MSQLPGVVNAVLDDRKITQYLLNTVHPTGASKTKFFMSFGFSPGNRAELKSALLDHPQNNPVTSQTSNPLVKVRGQLLARGAGRPKPLHYLAMDHRAARPRSEVHHRLFKPLSGRAPAARSEGRALNRNEERTHIQPPFVSAAVKSSMREVAAKSPRRSTRQVMSVELLTPVDFLQKQAFRLINDELTLVRNYNR
jgi:Domain of unknown function (DUF6883)